MKPQVELYTTTGCSHCASLIELLTSRLKSGAIGRLHLINLNSAPHAGDGLNIRSVPWFRIDRMQFEGGMSAGELDQWLAVANSTDGLARYFHHLIGQGRRVEIEQHLREDSRSFEPLIQLMGEPDSTVDLRLGIAATVEEMVEDPVIPAAIPALDRLANSSDPRIRADACHLLSLIDHEAARATLNRYLDDQDSEVREIAREAILAQ